MTCEYPPCTAIATSARAAVVEPEPIMLNLCDEHAAIVDANRATDSPDFWRWFDAMSGMRG